jgi:hypothetical protein
VPTRSGVLAAGRLLPAEGRDVFAVPEGHTVLLKTWYGYHEGSAPALLQLYVKQAGPYVLALNIHLPATDVYTWEGWLALGPGTTALLGTDSAAHCSYHLSGALLPGAIPPIPATLPG